ncbi:substrate-binding periplasmic protein [Chitinimonas sp. PSY-7]|uniref:substrate-binding periplasmic protein n=1 Tax=Chitinimonas sp. PSY-7 TaxID=3459088 RepID=UPI00403FEFE9
MHTALRLVLALTMLPAGAAVKIALCECDSPPLLELAPHSTEPVGGLIKDIGDLITNQMGETAVYQVLSRKRLDPALIRGEVDMICYLTPAWTAIAAQLYWTDDIVPQTELVLVDRNRPGKIRNLDDLIGMRIGLIHGFHYPQLAPLITVGKLKPVYEKDHRSNYKLLEHNLVDAVVSTDLQTAYYLREMPASASNIGLSDLVISVTPTQCAISKASKIPAKRVMDAVQQLKAQGAFEKLINRYRLNEQSPSKTEKQ